MKPTVEIDLPRTRTRAPRVRLTREFIEAVKSADCTITALACLAGFGDRVQLSMLLGAESEFVPLSPLMRDRLTTIASYVGFTGAIYKQREA